MSEQKTALSSPRSPVSAFIVTFNEARNIRRCLESVRWCDEIIVVDQGSSDGTLDICNEFSAQVFHRDWTGYVDQKRHGLAQCKGPWILNIDADEEVSPELREEMERVLEADAKSERTCNGYHLLRVVFYLGRWWRKGGWYPEYRLRFSKKSVTSWGGLDPHEKAIVQGDTRKLKGELRHYTYVDLSDHVARVNRHSSAAAKSLFAQGSRSNLFLAFVNPFVRFLKFYILKRGFLEGVAGFIVACLEGYYVFLKYVKLWELWRTQSPK